MAEQTSESIEYGRMLQLASPPDRNYPSVLCTLKESANESLAHGTRYEIRMANDPHWAMCWYSYPTGFARPADWDSFEVPSFFDAAREHWAPELGCYLVARLVTGSERASANALFALAENQRIPLLAEDGTA